MISDLPFWGPPGEYNEPDPFVWWIAAPVMAYLSAVWLAYNIAWYINRWKEFRGDALDDSH